MRELASWDEEETFGVGYDEGHEYCVNEREVNHSDQTIKTILAMVWRASFPLQSLRDFKYPCTAVSPIFFTRSTRNIFTVDRSADTKNFILAHANFSFGNLARYKNYTSIALIRYFRSS